MFGGLFSPLKACKVSATVSGVQFWGSKKVWRGLGMPKYKLILRFVGGHLGVKCLPPVISLPPPIGLPQRHIYQVRLFSKSYHWWTCHRPSLTSRGRAASGVRNGLFWERLAAVARQSGAKNGNRPPCFPWLPKCLPRKGRKLRKMSTPDPCFQAK